MKHALALLPCLALGFCATTQDIQQVCLPLTPYSPAQETQIATEYEALSVNAMLRAVVEDWIAMRDADRACIKGQEGFGSKGFGQ